MNSHSPIVSLLLAAALLLGAGPLFAQNQTNDPLVDQQQYLFDVHNIDQAWSYTTGSSNVRLGVYSFLGFTQNHEDLNGPRLQTSRGPLRPQFDYATEVAGIAGANTNNNLGIAGIDRVGELQSYSMLRDYSTGSDSERAVTVGNETFYLDLRHFADVIDDGRVNGVEVHLALIGLPSGLEVDYENPMEIETPDGMLPDPDDVVPDPPMNIDEAEAQLRNDALEALRDIFLQVLDAVCFGSGCTSPPDPMVAFRHSVGNLTRLGDGIVVTPAGDLDGPTTAANLPVSPGELGRYAVTVGGLKYDSNFELVKWDRSNAAPYVDVAGFATGLAGPAALGFSAYNTDFTSTAGAAAIGAGVASLLRAENPSLTTEDVDQILRRTARDVGPTGFDDGTGAGRIDAGGALEYVRTNDVQRLAATVSSVISDQTLATDVNLNDSGFERSAGPACTGSLTGEGHLQKFRARVPFTKTFSSPPDVWVRWSESDGYQSSLQPVDGGMAYEFDPFSQDLQVVDVDERGFVVEGRYWIASFWDRSNRRCAEDIRIPKFPGDFEIAYTAVGTEGAPPPIASISGPTAQSSGVTNTWTAGVSGGSGSTSYNWSVQTPSGLSWQASDCSTGSSCSGTFYNYGSATQSATVAVTVTRGSETDTATQSVSVSPDCSGLFCPQAFQRLQVGPLQEVRALQAATEEHTVALTWTATKGLPPAAFTVEHRSDSLQTWASKGSITDQNVMQTDSTGSSRYQYEAEGLEIGTHSFRLRVATEEGDPRYTAPVTAQVALQSPYQLVTYPNPARDHATIQLAVQESQAVAVGVYDMLGRRVASLYMLGRRVASLYDGSLAAQTMRRIPLEVGDQNLTSRTYFIRVTGEHFTTTEQMVVVR